MADQKISDLAAAATLTGAELVEVVQSGDNFRTTAQAVANLAFTAGATGTLPVPNGGTGVATFTAHGVLLGEGTSALAASAAMTNGQLLVGQTSADPLPKTLSGDATLAASGALTVANSVITNAKSANMANSTIKGRTTAGTGAPEDLTAAQARAVMQVGQVVLAIACSDETTALTTGTNKVKFINPYSTVFNLIAVVGSLSTAQTSGSIFTVDVNEAGTSILSTKLTIDNTETNSSTAATAAIISDASIAAYAEIEVDIDQVGDGTAKGLKVYLIGYPS